MTGRKTTARFQVEGKLDRTAGTTRGTLTIEPTGRVTVRAYKRRATYVTTLSAVADLIVFRAIMAERFKKTMAKAAVKKEARKRRAERSKRRRLFKRQSQSQS